MKIPTGPVDEVRVVSARKRKRKKKWARTGDGTRMGVNGRRGQGRSGSKELKRAESVGGIPLAPRDDTTTAYLALGSSELKRTIWRSGARTSVLRECAPLSRPEIILKIPSRICRYFVTRLAHVDASDLTPPVLELSRKKHISANPSTLIVRKKICDFDNFASENIFSYNLPIQHNIVKT